MTNSKSMDLLEQPLKLGSMRSMKKKVSDDYLNNIATSRMIWHLIKRHKFGLVSVWAVLITISYMFPPVWDILGSLVR